MCKWILRYQVEICTLRISIIFCKWNWSEHPVWHYNVHRSSLNSFYVLVYRCKLDIALNTHLVFYHRCANDYFDVVVLLLLPVRSYDCWLPAESCFLDIAYYNNFDSVIKDIWLLVLWLVFVVVLLIYKYLYDYMTRCRQLLSRYCLLQTFRFCDQDIWLLWRCCYYTDIYKVILLCWFFTDKCPHGHSLDGYCYVGSIQYGHQWNKVNRHTADVR